jgi:hypothetical protein
VTNFSTVLPTASVDLGPPEWGAGNECTSDCIAAGSNCNTGNSKSRALRAQVTHFC